MVVGTEMVKQNWSYSPFGFRHLLKTATPADFRELHMTAILRE